MNTYTDDYGRVWNIFKEYPSDSVNGRLPTFLATWVNKVGYVNAALFVRGNNNIWMTSTDGPFSNNQVRCDVDLAKSQ